MKIAITCRGSGLGAEVDPRFGRAKTFMIYDTETGGLEAVDNTQNLNASQGAGIQAAGNVSEHGVECVLTGHCGPKAFRALTAAGIKIVIGVEGAVSDAIANFKAGNLKPADAADVEGHWM